MKIAVALFLTLCTVAGYPAHGQSSPAISPNAALSEPRQCGATSQTLFAGDPRSKMTFDLQTSWIPGGGSWIPETENTGSLRYKIRVSTRQSSVASHSPEGMSVLLKRVSACHIYVEFYDKDEFLQREFFAPLGYDSDEEGHIVAVTGNAAVPMSASDYQKCASWGVAWACPKRR